MSVTRSPSSLQDLSRTSILGAVTLRRLEQVQHLPLPSALKQFLTLFRVPEDFDTEGDHMDYFVQFDHHPHHRTHRTHPAVCSLVNEQVLLKLEMSSSEECTICSVVGRKLHHSQENDEWGRVSHPGLQRCYMKMVDQYSGVTCYVLEFPVVSLKDLILRFCGHHMTIPEYLVWVAMRDLASAMDYLEQKGLHHELYDPQYIVLMSDGSIKFENMLVYLPTQGNLSYQCRNFTQEAIYIAPEQWLSLSAGLPAVVWALGCILYELTMLSPAFLVNNFRVTLSHKDLRTHRATWLDSQLNLAPHLPDPLPPTYSSKLNKTILDCLAVQPCDRPSLRQIQTLAAEASKDFHPGYMGPHSLLDMWYWLAQSKQDSTVGGSTGP